ncbi:LEM3 (ligand-effect modulator 3) family protein / CDC50 family protein [Rhynchospora pubera]|uniref:ALA-interacting subunit n=1 Tax=Rhynchospora pubera TaxID=906938 RepID=A0AAV8H6G7_9POAL|nr:LEM3 (ligand-effect modulator 3) family protein / CDC50 family protein [Rhynchospora pubera]
MEVEEATTSTTGDGDTTDRAFSTAHSGALYRFKQQNLPDWRPALTPGSVITIFLVMGFFFIPMGLVCLHASESVVEIAYRYDVDCVPESYKNDKVAYIKDSSVSKNCTRRIRVDKYMKAPIFVYYELDNFYQNHRRYVKSRNDKQLLYGLKQKDIGSCDPVQTTNGLPILPCGLIAWSLFNDSFNFARRTEPLKLNRKNISWQSDREHKFGKDVYPFNFQNGSLIGGGSLDPKVPLSEQEDLIVWMRTAALPKFRKLYGVIEVDLDANDVVSIHIANNYNTYSFGGRKRVVLTTSKWLGAGKNSFLGLAYLVTGTSSLLLSILFALIHVRNPRSHGHST